MERDSGYVGVIAVSKNQLDRVILEEAKANLAAVLIALKI